MVRFGWQLYMLYPKIAIKLTLAFKLTTPIATNILSHWLFDRQLLTQSLMLHYINHVSSRFVIQYEWRNALIRITMGPNATIVTGTMNAFNTLRPGALSLTWFTFNPCVDKQFCPTLHWACHYLSMLGLKAMHVSKSDPGDAYFSLNWVVIDSGIGLVPVRHQAVTLNDDESLLIGRLKNYKQWNLTPNICLVFQVNLSHNIVCRTAAILVRSECVNSSPLDKMADISQTIFSDAFS